METGLAVLLAAIFVGALGGALYMIVPPKETRTLKYTTAYLVAIAKRVVAGGIVGALWSPVLNEAVKNSGWSLDWLLITALVSIMSTGYVGIDVLKAALESRKVAGNDRG
jgi:hypothetical protein